MKNMGGLLKQAQEMQKRMKEVDNILNQAEVIGTINDGLVTAIMTGKGELKRIKIKPEAIEDIEMLEDLIVAACSEAKKKAESMSDKEMKNVTGGMPLPPGMNF